MSCSVIAIGKVLDFAGDVGVRASLGYARGLIFAYKNVNPFKVGIFSAIDEVLKFAFAELISALGAKYTLTKFSILQLRACSDLVVDTAFIVIVVALGWLSPVSAGITAVLAVLIFLLKVKKAHDSTVS